MFGQFLDCRLLFSFKRKPELLTTFEHYQFGKTGVKAFFTGNLSQSCNFDTVEIPV